MGFDIKLDHERKLVYYKHEGFIKREEIGEVWRQILSLKEFTEMSYDLISDYRYGKFDFIPNDDNITVIDNFFISIKHILKGKLEAVILDDPFSTAVSMLFENKYENSIGFKIKIFSSHQAAYKWIANFQRTKS